MNKRLRELNIKLNSLEQFFGLDILHSFPIDIALSTGDKCNLKCIFCIDREPNEDYKNITFKQFLRLKPLLAFASHIQIQGSGEPLFNPDYEKIFEYITKQCEGAYVSFNTNGILLDEEWISKLISNENIYINISVNAASEETYHCIMGKNYFEEVIINIKSLIKTRDNKEKVSPYVSISFVAMEQNIHEFPEFINLANDLGINRVILRDLIILRKEHEKYSLFNHYDKTTKALHQAFKNAKKRNILIDTSWFPIDRFLNNDFKVAEDSKFIEYSYLNCCPYTSSLNACFSKKCYDPWTSLTVCTAGDVEICCYSDAIAGNIYEQSFSEIWNGGTYRYYRKKVNTPYIPYDCSRCVKKRFTEIDRNLYFNQIPNRFLNHEES